MIFDLVKDFADVLDAMPDGHPRQRILKLLDEAIRRDVHFIDRHPTTLFQCMWNTCWWYGRPEAAKYYETPEHRVPDAIRESGLAMLLERWRDAKEAITPGFCWIRSMRPPLSSLGSGHLMSLQGHQDEVVDIRCSTDERFVASASHDGTIRLWDAHSGREHARFVQESGTDNPEENLQWKAVAISPDGLTLAGANNRAEIHIWSILTGQLVGKIDSSHFERTLFDLDQAENAGSLGEAAGIDFTPDGKHLVSYHDVSPNKILVWDIASLDLIRCESQYLWRYLVRSPVGVQYIAKEDQESRCVVLQDPLSGKERCRLPEPGTTTILPVMASSPSGRFVAIYRKGLAHENARPTVWDTHSGKRVAVCEGADDGVAAISVSADSARVAMSSFLGVASVWTGEGGNPVREFPAAFFSSPLCISANGSRLFTCSREDYGIHVRSLEESGAYTCPIEHEIGIDDFLLTRTNRYIVTRGSDGRDLGIALGIRNDLRIWSAETGVPVSRIVSDSDIEQFAVSADDTFVATVPPGDTASRAELKLQLWRLQSGELITESELPFRPVRGAKIEFAAHPEQLIYCAKGDLHVWTLEDTGRGRMRRLESNWNARISSVTRSPDNRYMFCFSSDWAQVFILDSVSLRTVAELSGDSDAITCYAVSPDGKQIAATMQCGTIYVWEIPIGREICRLAELDSHRDKDHVRDQNQFGTRLRNPIQGRRIVFSPDGDRLLSCEKNDTLRLWDLSTQKCVSSIHVTSGVTDIGFAFDNQTVVIQTPVDSNAGIEGYQVWNPDKRGIRKLQNAITDFSALLEGPNTRNCIAIGRDRELQMRSMNFAHEFARMPAILQKRYDPSGCTPQLHAHQDGRTWTGCIGGVPWVWKLEGWPPRVEAVCDVSTDGPETTQMAQMALGEHWGELTKLLRPIVWLWGALAAVFAALSANKIAGILTGIPFSMLSVCPFAFYRLWSFIEPGLYQRERKRFLTILTGASITLGLFGIGAGLAELMWQSDIAKACLHYSAKAIVICVLGAACTLLTLLWRRSRCRFPTLDWWLSIGVFIAVLIAPPVVSTALLLVLFIALALVTILIPGILQWRGRERKT
jgi:WD40 repeat protein